VGGTILDENFRVSLVLSSTLRSDTRSAPERATVGTKRFRASPFDVPRAHPAASLFAPGLGELGIQLAARAAPRIVRARPADPVCDRPAVSLAVFLEDAPIGVPSSPATTAGSSVLQRDLQRGGDAAPTGGWRIQKFWWHLCAASRPGVRGTAPSSDARSLYLFSVSQRVRCRDETAFGNYRSVTVLIYCALPSWGSAEYCSRVNHLRPTSIPSG